MPFFIRTMFKYSVKIVRIENIEDISEYIRKGLSKILNRSFHIQYNQQYSAALEKFEHPMPDGEGVFVFYDSWGEHIDPGDFVDYVRQSIGCANFYVEIRIKDESTPLVTAAVGI